MAHQRCRVSHAGDGTMIPVARAEAAAPSHSPVSAPDWTDSPQGLAKQVFSRRRAEAGFGAQLGEHGLDLPLAEAEVAKGGEDLGVGVGGFSAQRLPVRRAIGMAKDGPRVGPLAVFFVRLFDDE